MPLLIDDADWDALTDRIYVLVADLDTPDACVLLSSIDQAIRRSDPSRNNTELIALAHSVLHRLAGIWDRARVPVPLTALGGWFALAGSLPPESTPPNPADLTRTWADLFPAAAPDLADHASTERFADWLALADLLREYQPVVLDHLHFDDTYQTVDEFLTDVERAPDTIHPAAHEHVVSALRRIQILNPWFKSRAILAGDRLEHTSREPTAVSPDREPASGREPIGWRQFDVGRVLQDL